MTAVRSSIKLWYRNVPHGIALWTSSGSYGMSGGRRRSSNRRLVNKSSLIMRWTKSSASPLRGSSSSINSASSNASQSMPNTSQVTTPFSLNSSARSSSLVTTSTFGVSGNGSRSRVLGSPWTLNWAGWPHLAL